MDNEINDDGFPELVYTRSVRRRKKALVLDSPDERIENIPPALRAAESEHNRDYRLCNINKVLAFEFADGPPCQTGEQQVCCSLNETGPGVLQPQRSPASVANVMRRPAAAEQSSNVYASPLAWCGSPCTSPDVKPPKLAATGLFSSNTACAFSNGAGTPTCAGASSAVVAAVVAHGLQAEVPVSNSCGHSSLAVWSAGIMPQLCHSPASSDSTGKPDADSTTADQAAAASNTDTTSTPILLDGSGLQKLGNAGAAVPAADDRSPDKKSAAPTTPRHGLEDMDIAAALCADGGAYTDSNHSSSRADGSPATPTFLLQQPLDLNDPYTPWLRTSTKPLRPGSGSLFGSPISLSSSGCKSYLITAEKGNSSHQESTIVKLDGNTAGKDMAEGSMSAAAALVADEAPNWSSPGCNVSLCFATPPAYCIPDCDGSGAASGGSSSYNNNCPQTSARRKQQQASNHRNEEQQQQQKPSPQPQDSNSDSSGTSSSSSSSSDDEDEYPLTFMRRKQQQGHTNISRDLFRQTPVPNTHGVSSLQHAIRSSGGSSDTDSSSSSSRNDGNSSDSSWYSDPRGELSSAGDSPPKAPHSWRPSLSGRGRLGSKPVCGSSGHHSCTAGTTGSCDRITPGSSSSLVTRRRRQLHTPLGAGLEQQQHHDLQQQQQPASAASSVTEMQERATSPTGDPYDFDAYLEQVHTLRPCLSTIGRRQQQQQQISAGRSCVSPCAVLSFSPAAQNDTYSPAMWSNSTCKGGVTPASMAGRQLPLALAISPPLLKAYVLGSPGFATSKPLASIGRRGKAAAVSGVGGGKQPTAAGAGDAASRRQLQLGCMTAPAKAPSSRTFARQRQQLSQQLYDQWNAQVFDGGLPSHLPLVWNPRLTSTAGQVVDDGSQNRLKASLGERVPVRLELSTKVLDCEARLRTTLAHEMCHVAAWAISKEFKQHHGPAFWAWARRFEARVPGVKISTCHNYEIHAPFRWQCSNHSCGKQYHRHKRSIDPNKHACSRCNGTLLYLGKFSKDGRLVSSGAAGACTPEATPGAGGNVFSQFVKTHFAEMKRNMPTGTPHKEIMSRLAADYKQHKAAGRSEQPQQQQQPDLVGLADSEDEFAASKHRNQQGSTSSKQQQSWHKEDLSDGLLSFMQRLDLATG